MTMRCWLMMMILAVMATGSLVYQQYRNSTPILDSFNGETMGTYYQIKVVGFGGAATPLAELRPRIEGALLRINQSLSTWDTQSLISRFNANLNVTTAVEVDADFAAVLRGSQDLFAQSAGAFNPALASLITLWGFGRDSDDNWPTESEVITALSRSDFASLEFTPSDPATLRRSVPGVTLNFSAIAKGYAVDVLGQIVTDAGYQHYLVDIGGELRAVGSNSAGEPWRVGIEQPDQNGIVIQTVTKLHDEAIATSGDYRNYREKNGKRFSHIIDPRTGYPITHDVASVSVRAASTMVADGWATALLVMGQSGLETCKNLNLACLMIVRNGDTFTSHSSPAWLS
ncbi:MAG: FAD:protein FMN transferase [Alphaproteobacteria bacterium]|nr:FAD:protein FMN transferase [Alphaproteobacteria bacterium]